MIVFHELLEARRYSRPNKLHNRKTARGSLSEIQKRTSLGYWGGRADVYFTPITTVEQRAAMLVKWYWRGNGEQNGV